jgi:hypothetical protein
MQKFLKDRALFTRIRIMFSVSCNAGESKTALEFVEIFASKTPAVEPPPIRQIPFRTESCESPQSHPGKVSDEAWRRQGELEGVRGCCAPRAQQPLFKEPLRGRTYE